jgi:hypothetical protein
MPAARPGPFAFVQFEFGYPLGPADGRYLSRGVGDDEPRAVLVIATCGAPRRHLVRGRRAKRVSAAGEEAPPLARATIIRAQPFESEHEAKRWLAALKDEERDTEIALATSELNRLLRAHRAAAADPFVRDVAPSAALITRIGFGSGEEVAEGESTDAFELPRGPARQRRVERLSPQERTAAVVGGRQAPLASEELVLRARTDVDAGQWREAALQARIALECLVGELAGDGARFTEPVQGDRDVVTRAGNAALDGEVPAELHQPLTDAVQHMEQALRRFRLDQQRSGG